MKAEDLKKQIEEKVGIPAELLNGETDEENIAQARALLAFKKRHEKEQPKTTKQQFTDWLKANEGNDAGTDPAGEALAELERNLKIFPTGLQDAGEADHKAITGTPQQEFSDWVSNKLAYNPKA